MTETSTLTPGQELQNKLGTAHPGKQSLKILERLETLEAAVQRLKGEGREPNEIIVSTNRVCLATEPAVSVAIAAKKRGRPRKTS